MTDPAETSENISTAAHSGGEPDPITGSGESGSDVGGPAAGIESSAESALDRDSSTGDDDAPDDQAQNPL
jgi:hypothetical protein